jgi:predicted PurR-regulated permease PerM
VHDPPPPPAWRAPLNLLLVASVIASALVARPLALELGAGLVFGYVTERPVDWVLRKIHRTSSLRWRWAAATTVALLTVATLLVPSFFALWVAVDEFARLVTSLRVDAVARTPTLVSAWLTAHLGSMARAIPMADLVDRGRRAAESLGAWAARTTGRGLAAAPDLIFSTIVVLTAWVTFAVRGPSLRAAILPKLLPWPREREILQRTTAEVIEGVVLANVGVSVIQAAIISVATVAMGVPHAIVWGVASFVLSFIPLVGTALVTLSAALYLFASGRIAATVAMLVVAVIAGSIDNVLRPMLARGSSELPFVWMMVAFVGGVTVFGAAGVLLGPLVMALAVALWERHEEDHRAPPA